MISFHPYNTWPLHVKLFTEEAAKGWKDANKCIEEIAPLPMGFTCITELEGVDGKSGKTGSGRIGPIDVTDGLLYVLSHQHSLTVSYSQGRSPRYIWRNTSLWWLVKATLRVQYAVPTYITMSRSVYYFWTSRISF